MNILAIRIDLRIPGARSLKDKRFILKSIKDRIKNRFNVSVAEVEYTDLWQRAQVGIAFVSRDYRFGEKVTAKMLNLIESEPRVEVLDVRTDAFRL